MDSKKILLIIGLCSVLISLVFFFHLRYSIVTTDAIPNEYKFSSPSEND